MTKIIDFSEMVRICEQKRQTGDYQTLANVLEVNTDTARMRVYRKDEKAVRILYRIIQQREELKREYQNQQVI